MAECKPGLLIFSEVNQDDGTKTSSVLSANFVRVSSHRLVACVFFSWISPRSFLPIDGVGSGQRRWQAASSMRFFFRPKRRRTKRNCIFHSRTHPFHNFFHSWTQLLEEQIETNALDNAIVNVNKLRLFTIVSNEGMRQCSWLDETTGGVRVGWMDTFEKLRKPLCF